MAVSSDQSEILKIQIAGAAACRYEPLAMVSLSGYEKSQTHSIIPE